MNSPILSKASLNSALRSKTLKTHWQPNINIRSAFPFLITICLCFTILSLSILITALSVYTKELDYTDCVSINHANIKCSEIIKTVDRCFCDETLTTPNKRLTVLKIYYRIDGMYQNHRLYSDSFDFPQQMGIFMPTTDSSCGDISKIHGKVVVPCGRLPNSLFNDSFEFFAQSTKLDIDTSTIVTFPEKKVYANPNVLPLSDAFKDFEKPPAWPKPIYQLDEMDRSNNGFLNRLYITWMRTYPFPGVLKQIGQIKNISLSMKDDQNIRIRIKYSYPVGNFSGRKKIVFVEQSWLGFPNTDLGFIYCGASIVCLIFIIYFWLSSHFNTVNRDI